MKIKASDIQPGYAMLHRVTQKGAGPGWAGIGDRVCGTVKATSNMALWDKGLIAIKLSEENTCFAALLDEMIEVDIPAETVFTDRSKGGAMDVSMMDPDVLRDGIKSITIGNPPAETGTLPADGMTREGPI